MSGEKWSRKYLVEEDTMSKKQTNLPKYFKISKYISVFLMIAILYFQFTPFWSWTSVEDVEKKTITVDKRADVTYNEDGELVITIGNGDSITVIAPEIEEGATEEEIAEATGKVKLDFVPETKNVDYEMSIGQYIWFPYDYPTADEYFQSKINEDYTINDAVAFPVAILVLCVVSIVFCLRAKKLTFLIWPGVTAVVTALAYLIRPELKLGADWVSHLYPSIGVVLLVAWTFWKKNKVEKEAKIVY